MHFKDEIIQLASSALVSGNDHNLEKDLLRKSLKVVGGRSILEDTHNSSHRLRMHFTNI